MMMRDSLYCESAQEALLVGRYLKENGLFKTLRCFLRETPIREVPQVDKENMLSVTEILRDFRCLRREKEEFEEQKKRMLQYEEILNLLFEELRDVYNFRSSPGNGGYIHDAVHPQSDVQSQQEDSILVEDYGLHNCENVVPVILPEFAKQRKGRTTPSADSADTMQSGSGKSGRVKASPNKITAFLQQQQQQTEASGDSHRYMHEHHHYHSQQRKVHGGRSRRTVLSKPTSPSGFVAYSSLPVGCSQSCGHTGKPCTDMEMLGIARANSSYKEYAGPGMECKPTDGKDKAAIARHSYRELSPLFSTSSEDQSKHDRNSSMRPGTAGSKDPKAGVDASSCLSQKCSPSISGSSTNERSTTNSFGSSHGMSPSPLKFDRKQASVVDGDQMISNNAALCATSQLESFGASRDCDHYVHQPQKQQHSQPQTRVFDIGAHGHHHEETDNHNPILLATETANLLERLLPLVADSETMKSFINNLHTLSPQRTPRNCHHQEPASTFRTPTTGRPIADGSRSGSNSMSSELDDEEVLAELEEAVGKTVDDILERYST